MEKDLSRNPLMFGQFTIKQKESDKYLGQVLRGGGLEESAAATVRERLGRIKGATMEIKSIVEEFQMPAVGGMMAAWELWEKALIPNLLSGAGTWLGDCREAIKLCDNLQNFFWRVLLKVPESCPKVALRCETKMMGMKWRICEEKIFLHKFMMKEEPKDGQDFLKFMFFYLNILFTMSVDKLRLRLSGAFPPSFNAFDPESPLLSLFLPLSHVFCFGVAHV